MKQKIWVLSVKFFLIVSMLLYLPFYATAAKYTSGVKVVGLYSETDAGQVSYRVGGSGEWTAVKIGQIIPVDAEIRINVDRDWFEFCPISNPNEVYELTGSETETVIKTVEEILKGKKRKVSFPKPGDKLDSKYENKVIVKEYWGKQNYRDSEGFRYIKYGDILDASGTIQIIAINNTLTLVFADGQEQKVIGPLKFQVDKLLKGENLYKYLNVR